MAYIVLIAKSLERKNAKRIYTFYERKGYFLRQFLANLQIVSCHKNSKGSHKSTRRKRGRELQNDESRKTRFSVQWANVNLSPEEIGKKYVVTQAADTESNELPTKSQEWKELISKLDSKQLEKWKQGKYVPPKMEVVNKVRRSYILHDEEIQTRRVTGKEFVTDKENELVKSVRERLKEQENKYVPSRELLIGSGVTKSQERCTSSFPRDYEFSVIVKQRQVVGKIKQLVEKILRRSVSENNVVIKEFGFHYRVGIRTKVHSLEEIKKVYAAMHENENVAFSLG